MRPLCDKTCVRSACRIGVPGLVMLLIGWSTALGQGAAKPATQDITLVTKDNHELKATYFKSGAGEEAPVVILLHGKGGNRLVWKPFAEQLQKVDFAVITIDLRGHGESGEPDSSGKKNDTTPKRGDYQAMVLFDLEAVKKFLYEEHQAKQLNMNRLGIVAADIMTPVAVAYAEYDWEKKPWDDAPVLALKTPKGQDIQVLGLVSPESSAPGLGTSKTLAMIRTLKLPVLISVGNKNPGDLSAAKKTHDILAPKKDGFEHVYFEQYDSKLSGTDLLGKGLKTELHLYNFLIKHLKDNTRVTPWRDRKSKLQD